MRHLLEPHPDTPCRAVSTLHVAVARQPRKLVLTYVVAGEVENLRLPRRSASVRADELWKHTCFEAFIRAGDALAYREFNFSPSTAWAAYDFTGYREGMRSAQVSPPEIEIQAARRAFTLKAAFELNLVADGFRLALSAVVEELNGSKSYWALAHPLGKPDFHHPAYFTLELGPHG